MMLVGGEWQAEHCLNKSRFVCAKKEMIGIWKIGLLIPNQAKEVNTPFIEEAGKETKVVVDDLDKTASILTQRQIDLANEKLAQLRTNYEKDSKDLLVYGSLAIAILLIILTCGVLCWKGVICGSQVQNPVIKGHE